MLDIKNYIIGMYKENRKLIERIEKHHNKSIEELKIYTWYNYNEGIQCYNIHELINCYENITQDNQMLIDIIEGV